VDEMDNAIATMWNSVVGKKDLVYIIGDFAFSDHRKWVNELNGKKILMIGDHDHMSQDILDLFKGDLAITSRQFREVHTLLVRKVCGQWISFCHWPQRSWFKSVHGSWCVCGHSHGRCRVSKPGEAGGGLILDVGWDVFKKPIPFAVLEQEMKKKFELMPQNFREHVLYGKPLGRMTGDDAMSVIEGSDNVSN
jgi:calcineurin-like phosphoesterase family protein